MNQTPIYVISPLMDIAEKNIETSERRIYGVSEITASIKSILEKQFSFIWISGEISNFRKPSSGHCYFSLKDEKAQISAVMFRGQNKNLTFDLENGLNIVGLGRISVYEPRGSYQIILEYIEPKGIGALQAAFEKLKQRLHEEGLFDSKFKKSLPYIPKKISFITSPTGAVVHDMINIIMRRFSDVHIEIVPVKVQGYGAVQEIVEAFNLLDNRDDSDVIILARGGGSIEDLQAFNTEEIARSIFNCKIPVISAIGHEIDFTISDFVADLRAPTPSAAAELVIPIKHDLETRHVELSLALKTKMLKHLEYFRQKVKEISKRLVDPNKHVQDLRLKLDDYFQRLIRTFTRRLQQEQDRLDWRIKSLMMTNPIFSIRKHKEKLDELDDRILISLNKYIYTKTSKLRELSTTLHALSPSRILERGYSITRTIPEATVVRDPNDVLIHQNLEVLVAKGAMICRVERKLTDDKKNV